METLKHRKSLRLPHYNYHKNGSYFITICIQGKENRLGTIIDKKMILNNAGYMVDKWISAISKKFATTEITHKVIMPNHIHFIVSIVGADPCVCPNPTKLPTIIQWFKTMTTNAYIKGVKNNTFPPFHKRIWQRNYYEHIIRNEESFYQIAQYIEDNPKSWHEDSLYSD